MSIHPPPIKIDAPVSADKGKSRAILCWANYQQSLEQIEAKLVSLTEEIKIYQRALAERRLQVAEIEKQLLGPAE